MVDIAERLYSRWLAHRAASRKKDLREPSAIELATVKERFSSLAALLEGVAIEIKGGHVLVEARGCIVLPDRFDLFSESALNEDALKYRIVFAASSWASGIVAPSNLPDEARLLFILLSVGEVSKTIASHYPGAREIFERVAPELLKKIPVLRTPSTRAAVLHEAIRRLIGGTPIPSSKIAEEISGGIMESPSVSQLRERFQILWARLQEILRPGMLQPDFSILWSARATALATSEIVAPPAAHEAGKNRAKVITLDRTAHAKLQDPTQQESVPLFHSFEKTETSEDYDGEQGTPLPADIDLEEQALRDLSLTSVIRTSESTPGLLKADMVLDGAIAEVADIDQSEKTETLFHYPEWHYRTKSYRKNWVTLIERDQRYDAIEQSDMVSEILRTHRAAVADIRKELVRLFSTRDMRDRQLDGPEIDLQALIERHADLCAAYTPDARLYMREKKKVQDVALLLLFDTSLSTDSWVDGRRILDIEIASLAIISEAFRGFLDREVSIAHFNSRTRNECNFNFLKRFEESWESMRNKLPALHPYGYTRIGPALRHANQMLTKVAARRKIVLLVSDGKPTDYDRYEGRYGIEDVAQAVREGRQQHISTFTLAIDREAKHYISQMMGSRHYRILPRASLLPNVMAEFFLRAVH